MRPVRAWGRARRAVVLGPGLRLGWSRLVSHRLDVEASDARDRAESEALLAVESFEAAL